MESISSAFVLASFGGPRSLDEVPSFLKALLKDPSLIKTPLPPKVHAFLFSAIARLRSPFTTKHYRQIGGFSPLYQEVKTLAKNLENLTNTPFIPFHRHLTNTHEEFLEQVRKFEQITVFSLFPHYSPHTTGSCLRWLQDNLDTEIQCSSPFGTHPLFVKCFAEHIQNYIKEYSLEDPLLIFTAHGLPTKDATTYISQCESSYHLISSFFPEQKSVLCYQSRFGFGDWTKPYTQTICRDILSFEKRSALFIPLSFIHDNLETLYEIEHLYLPSVRNKGIKAHRLPAVGKSKTLPKVMVELLKSNQEIPQKLHLSDLLHPKFCHTTHEVKT